jgi:hypothetical protein
MVNIYCAYMLTCINNFPILQLNLRNLEIYIYIYIYIYIFELVQCNMCRKGGRGCRSCDKRTWPTCFTTIPGINTALSGFTSYVRIYSY